jgi:hypothetical protein
MVARGDRLAVFHAGGKYVYTPGVHDISEFGVVEVERAVSLKWDEASLTVAQAEQEELEWALVRSLLGRAIGHD